MSNSSIFNSMIYGHQNNSVMQLYSHGKSTYLQQSITRTARNTLKQMMNSMYGYLDIESYGQPPLDINPYLQEPVLNVAANSEHPAVKAKLKELEMLVRLCHTEELAEQQKNNKYHTANKERLIKEHISITKKQEKERQEQEQRYWVKLNKREIK
jgi:hypothetical protein